LKSEEDVSPAAERHELELRAGRELERLPGVLAAAVWIDDDRSLRDARIHIMPGAAALIVGNAGARVLQALGISAEPAALRTTVLALAEEMQSFVATPAAGGRCLLLQDLSLSRTGAHVICRVQLVRGGVPAAGEARELDTPAGRVRAVANATLRAAEATVQDLAFGLEAAAVIPFSGRSYAIVSIEASIGRRVASLAGLVSVEAQRGDEEAVCLATLRAIDRWIGV
jgi:hypothetical protein